MFDYEKECKDFQIPDPKRITKEFTEETCGKCPLKYECYKRFIQQQPTKEDLFRKTFIEHMMKRARGEDD